MNVSGKRLLHLIANLRYHALRISRYLIGADYCDNVTFTIEAFTGESRFVRHCR